MALINSENNYLKITGVMARFGENNNNFYHIEYNIFRNSDVRLNPNEFDVRKSGILIVDSLGNVPKDNMLNTLKYNSYVALKDNGFGNWIDA